MDTIASINCHLVSLGISSAPEHYQRRMNEFFNGLDGVVCQIHDILVFNQDAEQHDDRLIEVLKIIEAAGAILKWRNAHLAKRN